jgi:hypothetical protein
MARVFRRRGVLVEDTRVKAPAPITLNTPEKVFGQPGRTTAESVVAAHVSKAEARARAPRPAPQRRPAEQPKLEQPLPLAPITPAPRAQPFDLSDDELERLTKPDGGEG